MAGQRVFYGWWVTVAFAIMVLLSTGVRFSVGPFLKPIVTDLGTDRATYSLIVSLSLLLYGVFMPFVGRLVERWGARPVAVLGISALGGASMSGSLAMTSALTADIYGSLSVGSVFGTIFVVHQGGAALGSWLGGLLFELTGNYGAAFAIASVQLLAAAVVSLAIDETARGVVRFRPAAAGR